MVRKLLTLAGFTFLLLVSCDLKQNKTQAPAGPEPTQDQPRAAEKDIEKVNAFFDNPFLDEAVKMPPLTSGSIKEIESLISPILNSKEENVPNQYDKTIIDKRILLTTGYYSVGYYYSELKKEYMLEFFAIDNPKTPLKFDVSLGINEEDIIKIFGKNDTKIQRKDSSVLVYFTSQSGQINFTIKNGTLSAIGFTHTV
jgi:hypothetical protein